MSNYRKLAAMVVVASFTAAALAMSPTPVPWGYPALDALCLLQEAAAVDGVSGAYPIGRPPKRSSASGPARRLW